MKKISSLFKSFFSSYLLWSGKKELNLNLTVEKSQKAFANRPSFNDPFGFYLISLENPPLLENLLAKEDLFSQAQKKEKL